MTKTTKKLVELNIWSRAERTQMQELMLAGLRKHRSVGFAKSRRWPTAASVKRWFKGDGMLSLYDMACIFDVLGIKFEFVLSKKVSARRPTATKSRP